MEVKGKTQSFYNKLNTAGQVMANHYFTVAFIVNYGPTDN
jgi:hypothetical protein